VEWVRTKADELAVARGCYFDLEAADRVRRFFRKYLRHSKGEFAGKPFELFDWQWRDIVAPAFGWKMPDGTRRYRHVSIWVPKKNGKSTLLSGIALYLLCCDNEPGAEVYSAAGDRRQASIIYNEAAAMVDAAPELAKVLKVRQSRKLIKHGKSNSTYEALSADAPTKEGLNIHGLLFDELHTQPNSVLYDTLKYGGAARRQPLFFEISTAGIKDETTLWWEHWTKAKQIVSGELTDISTLAVMYAADESDDWTCEATWEKANPSYHTGMNKRQFAEECEEAKRNAAAEATFKRYRLNIPVTASSAWIQRPYWDACISERKEVEKSRCIGGLDLASTTDLNAMVELHKLKDCIWLEPHFWCPELKVQEREKQNRQRFARWVDGGWIKQTPTSYTDYKVIHDDVFAICKRANAEELAIDSWNFTQLALDLQNSFKAQRVPTKIVAIRTGFQSISAATKEFERLILSGRLKFANNPVLTWMFTNTVIESDPGGNRKPDRKKSADKIDGIVAAILALARLLVAEEKVKSKYETQGLQTRRLA
jgi:phage terminase large subunit-like protein